MSYIYRLVGDGALCAVTYNGAIKNYVKSVTPTTSGCRFVDPISTSPGDAILVPTSGGSITIPSPLVISETDKSFAIELVFHINPVSSDTVIASWSGAAGTFITAQSNQRLNIRLPFSGYTSPDVTVNCAYDQAHHLIVNISPLLVEVILDSNIVASFTPSERWVSTGTQAYLELGNLQFASASTAFIIDTVAIFTGTIKAANALKHYLSAFISPKSESAVDYQYGAVTTEVSHKTWTIPGEAQDYIYRFHSPATTSWDEWTRDNVGYYGSGIGINLYNGQQYKSSINAYYLNDLQELARPGSGTIHCSLASYSSANHPNRSLFYLSKIGYTEYEMRFVAGVANFTIWTPTYTGNTFTGSYTATNYALTNPVNGQPYNCGIVWDKTSIRVIYANTVAHTISDVLGVTGYKFYMGTGRSSVAADDTTQSILTGSGVYTMRVWDTNDYLTSGDITRVYGKYTFSSADAAKYKVPVYADATASIEMPLGYSDDTAGTGSSSAVVSYNMQQFIDGPAGLITEPVY
jgi:hypothetical protein